MTLFVLMGSIAGIKHGPLAIVIKIDGLLLGLYLGKKFDKYVNSICTSLVGAASVVRGIGFYGGGFPDLVTSDPTRLEINKKMIVYFTGFVILTICGVIFQLKKAPPPPEKEGQKKGAPDEEHKDNANDQDDNYQPV